MRDSQSEIKVLKNHWPDSELLEEGGRKYAIIPTLKVSADGKEKVVSALLQPSAYGGGYTTRLYFSEQFTSKGANWNVFSILGRSWHACSWNGVPEDLPWFEIIASHLRPLQ